MNEVTRIHLGRQPFTISVEAHKALRDYIAAIKKQVGDKDVVEEVELRMAELLTERGVTGDKVILASDVDFLKEQLGNPKDFKEDADDAPRPSSDEQNVKRLFRDTDNAMLAGVAAGLSNYFGIDVLLIRILFVVGALTGGWGILLYIAMWLLVPAAKTSSDRLQMQGKPITVESLREVVDRADLKAATSRANNTVVSAVNTFFKAVLKVFGIIFILTGLALIFSLIAAKTYMATHGGQIFQENIFPIGATEHLLLDIGLILSGIISLFIVLAGMALFRRKWPVRGWITGILLGIFFIGLAAGIALAADTAPNIRDRYNAQLHTITRTVQPFTEVDIKGEKLNYSVRHSQNYTVSIRYFGNINASAIKTDVVDGKLVVDSSQLHPKKCDMICLFPNNGVEITIYAPDTRVLAPPGFEVIFPGDSPYFR